MSDELNIRLTMPTQRWIGPEGEVLELPVGDTAPEGYELWAYSGYVAVCNIGDLDDNF